MAKTPAPLSLRARAEIERRKRIDNKEQTDLVPTDINEFAERVLKDENGNRVKQAEVHKTWHEHIDYARNKGKQPCIIAPWGHGKTQQVIVLRALWEIGKNPDIRIKIVCNDDENSRARVRAIARYIERDEDYHAIFPSVRPGAKEKWTQHEIFVERTSGARSIDPTVQAKGILSTGIGGRCDLLLFDDIVDLRNSVENVALQPKVIDAFKNTWMSRLTPTGWAQYIATRWTESDCTAALLNDPELARGYCFLIQKISEDMSCIECERIG